MRYEKKMLMDEVYFGREFATNAKIRHHAFHWGTGDFSVVTRLEYAAGTYRSRPLPSIEIELVDW